MPRKPRQLSKSGVYHIIVRGINRQDIFFDEEDYERYIETLERMKEKSVCKIYCYCLMSNHVHMVIKEEQETVGQYIKRIGSSYVYWYNKKYRRSGHLFQDRYKSEPIEDDRQLLTVTRYVLNNPKKADMVNKLDDYRYSSWQEYIGRSTGITDTKLLIDIAGSLKSFIEFINQPGRESFMRAWSQDKLQDDELIDIIRNRINKAPIELQSMNRNERNQIIKELKKISGVSIRQIERVTGIGRGAIYKV